MAILRSLNPKLVWQTLPGTPSWNLSKAFPSKKQEEEQGRLFIPEWYIFFLSCSLKDELQKRKAGTSKSLRCKGTFGSLGQGHAFLCIPISASWGEFCCPHPDRSVNYPNVSSPASVVPVSKANLQYKLLLLNKGGQAHWWGGLVESYGIVKICWLHLSGFWNAIDFHCWIPKRWNFTAWRRDNRII